MRSVWFTRAGRAALAVAMLVALAAVAPASAKPAPGRPTKRSGINLFALTFGVMNANRVFCGINNIGEVCVDPTNSPVVGGGFWPKGTPDQYVFNSGLQLAGTIPSGAGFAWAGDTVGAFFFDARGNQNEGDPITLVFNSLDPTDAAGWPNGAVVRDTAIYNSVLIGRNSIGQQDLWVRTWDGNPAFTGSARSHPMGILVETRGLAWNFPTGNEDIVYFVYTFYNITASSAAAYGNLNPAIRGEIAAIGADYQVRNEAAYGINIPDNGYAITNMFAAFSADMDVGDAGFNYATAVVPFAMGLTYKEDFLEPNWVFPADIFGAPFVPSPGFIGVKYLRSPLDATGQPIGLTIFSNTVNAATGYPDPSGVKQLYRYLSGTSTPAAGDNPCTFQGQQLALRLCFLSQTAADARFFQSSGPMTLNPGEAQSIVVAYIFAAPTPAVVPFIGGDLKPGIPPAGDSLVANPALVRTIDRAMGWVSQADADTNQTITQDEVVTVPRSLLNKALVAQSVYDNKFLLPFAPEPPTFFLVPGDNQVTVVWQKSETETVKAGGGDPYYAIASDPTSTLYDANFRQYDVEGYRIYRGRTTGALDLVVQFDYAGTSIIDYTGNFAYTTDADGDGLSECAPELGVQDDCPTTFPDAAGVTHDLIGDVVQIPAGGRVQLADGSILILKADTAVTGNASGGSNLISSGVGFAFNDLSVRNNFSYFYSVTAFDVNSLASGPSAIESTRATKLITPRRGPSTTAASLSTAILGGDGTVLNVNAPYPTIDPATGTFSGNMPPANAGALSLVAGSVLLPAGDIVLRVDSASAGTVGGIGTPPPNIYLTIVAGGDTIAQVIPLAEPDFSATSAVTWDFGVAGTATVPIDSVRARAFGLSFTKDTRLPISFGSVQIPMCRTSPGIAVCVGRFGLFNSFNRYLTHSRWFTGNSEPPDPTVTSLPDSAHHAGALPGVSKIWAPAAYRQPDGAGTNQVNVRFRNYSYGQTAFYPADFLVTWNADSSLTVFDSSHHSTLPYAPNAGTGWGFLTTTEITAAGFAVADLRLGGDLVPTDIANMTYNHLYAAHNACDQFFGVCATLTQKAAYEALDLNHDGAADANGIVLMINGEAFFMALAGGIPAAGTQWRLRTVVGRIAATACTDTLGGALTAATAAMSDCSGYTYSTAQVDPRPVLAPGLTYRVSVANQYTIDSTTSGNLANVHTVPDPYYVSNALEATANTKVLKFVNLPPKAIIRIYSLSGVLVNVLTHHDPGGGGEATWNLRNRNNQFVASGVYFFHVEGIDGKTKIGRFTVVNFAP